jgi:hypothetical protein
LDFSSLQRKFSGIPSALTTHSIKITANDNYGGSIFNVFNIQVINNPIIVANPIPDQNVTVGEFFELTIDGNNVFNSINSSLSLEVTNIPNWLTLIPLNPNPTFKGSYNTLETTRDVAVSGNYAYVTTMFSGSSGLQIIDVSNPTNPTFKGSYDTPDNAVDVILSGNYAYVAASASGLQIIDISDPSSPTFKGSYGTSGFDNGVAVSGNYAYVAVHGEYSSGLRIIDISDPAKPMFKGFYNTPDRAEGIALSENYAYVADYYSGLQIIDISDPSNPTFKGSYDTPNTATGVALSENHAYVADSESGLQVIDVSDPANPIFKGSYDTPDYAIRVAISGNYAYVADWESGLQIIDVSNPSSPTFKGLYNTPGMAQGVALSGNYAYVADGMYGLQIIALNSDKLTLLGTPNFVGTYGVDITACNEIMECIIDTFNIHVINNSPIVSNPLQNQMAIVNTLFSYTFSNDTFIDPNGHSLTYTAKLSDDSSLPSWLNFNSPQRKFSGTPTTPTTYPIKVTANDNYEGVISTMFNLIVKDSSIIDDTTDTTDTTDMTDLTAASIIISSMTIVACTACIASFSLPLIIGGGIVALRRHRNKILGNGDNIKAKELQEVKELKESETSNDKKVVVKEKLLQQIEE